MLNPLTSGRRIHTAWAVGQLLSHRQHLAPVVVSQPTVPAGSDALQPLEKTAAAWVCGASVAVLGRDSDVDADAVLVQPHDSGACDGQDTQEDGQPNLRHRQRAGCDSSSSSGSRSAAQLSVAARGMHDAFARQAQRRAGGECWAQERHAVTWEVEGAYCSGAGSSTAAAIDSDA